MDAQEKEKIKMAAAAWKRYEEEIKVIRAQELKALNDSDNSKLIDALCELGVAKTGLRPSSGLVEQQRLFTILREKQSRKKSREEE